MSHREVTRRLLSWDVGRPTPRFDTLHHAVAPPRQALVVAFVRMAGESRPWGIAWGHPGDLPRVESVPDGRVRDDVAAMSARFAEDLLAHLRVHNWTYDPAPEKPEPSALTQLWLPNGQHVAMLHQLDYAYSQTRFGGADRDILNALGRLCGWLFRDSFRKGNQHLVNASEALREAYVFPAQDVRQAHLGYLLAWLGTDGDRWTRMAAAAQAEGRTVSPTMDPTLERDDLGDAVGRCAVARRGGTTSPVDEAHIASLLDDELRRRWDLCAQAYDVLATNDRRRNFGVTDLVKEAHTEFWYQHQRIELRVADPNQGPAFVAHPETDFHGSAAASRYLMHAAADEAYMGALIHDDGELFAEALQDGHAFRCTVTVVRDEGEGRKTVPVWVVETDPGAPQRIREGGRVVPYGSRGHEATVRVVEVSESALKVELEWGGRKTQPLGCGVGAKPADAVWAGQDTAFVVSDAANLTRMRSQRVWKAKDGPGAWLTHGRVPVTVEIGEDSSTPDTLVDDIRQIEGEPV